MEIVTAWPYVGAGSAANPYRVSFVPLTVAGQARLLRSGVTCFRRELDGRIDVENDPPLATLAKQTLASAQNVADVGGHRLVAVDVPEELFPTWQTFSGYFWSTSVDAVGQACVRRRRHLEDQFRTLFPDAGWDSDPDVAAAQICDQVGLRGLFGLKVRNWWAQVIDPDLPTPVWFDDLVVDDVADFAKADLYDTDDLSSEIGVADAAFEFLAAGDIGRHLGVF